MKKKISYRKKVIMETLAPTLLILAITLIRLLGGEYNGILADGALVLAIGLFLFMLINSYRKNYEPEDEMARQNQQKADGIAFNLAILVVAMMMMYTLFVSREVVFSIMSFVLIFVGMNLLSLLLFLYFDIRGE